jgi:phenylalanyl-tRNA synthetase alpha chain
MADTPLDAVDALDREIDAAFAATHDDHELRNVYARFLGREGALTVLMKRMPELPPAERKTFGQRVNAVKQRAERARESADARLRTEARERELNCEPLDITMPGRTPRLGRIHPVMRVLHEAIDVFTALGFDVAEGPEAEFAEFNFDRLGFPADHPAMDMQDTFFLATEEPARRPLLRTHTSPVQVREMLSHPPPVMIVAPGVVYRRDDDVTHSPMFMQIEGLVVDRGISMAHLKGTLDAFVHRLFGPSVPTKLRASYFPFTEPSGGKDAKCRVCKGTGWIEVLGCGMVDPVVFEHAGYDPEKYTGFAFGMGLDRLTMLRYGIPDIRLLYDTDVRFLESL